MFLYKHHFWIPLILKGMEFLIQTQLFHPNISETRCRRPLIFQMYIENYSHFNLCMYTENYSHFHLCMYTENYSHFNLCMYAGNYNLFNYVCTLKIKISLIYVCTLKIAVSLIYVHEIYFQEV